VAFLPLRPSSLPAIPDLSRPSLTCSPPRTFTASPYFLALPAAVRATHSCSNQRFVRSLPIYAPTSPPPRSSQQQTTGREPMRLIRCPNGLTEPVPNSPALLATTQTRAHSTNLPPRRTS